MIGRLRRLAAIGRLRRMAQRARLFSVRNRQYDNGWLRAYFRDTHAIDVGLYSYGCFDPWRVQGPATIGRYCSFAKTARAVNANHPLEAITTHPMLYERAFGLVDCDRIVPRTLVVEDDVWIGHNALLLPGCSFVGRGAVIGAGAIVTRDVPRYAIVVGNPAKLLRMRFPDDLCAALDDSGWWHLTPSDIGKLLREDRSLIDHPTIERLARSFPFDGYREPV